MPLATLPALLFIALAAAPAGSASPWRELQPGLELGTFPGPENTIGDRRISVLRVDLSRYSLALLSASADGGGKRTARAFAEQSGAVAAINASMFKEDNLTSVALLRTRGHINNGAGEKKYKAVLAFDPLAAGLPYARMLDLERDDLAQAQKQYASLAQNLRMVDARGKNRWGASAKKWSTAAVGLDAQGRLLLIHCRSPYPVRVLTEALLALPIGLAGAMYVEGGPEAQLFVRAGGETIERVGSYETGFHESDDNLEAWPIPNVLAVVPRKPGP